MTEAKRVVFDLSGTLIDDNFEWRPGAKELLGKLKSEGVSAIVWTNTEQISADRIIRYLDGFSDLVQLTVTTDTSKTLIDDLAKNMEASGDSSKIKLAGRMKTMYMPKIPAAVGSNILVDDELVLREGAKRLGTIVIDPTPTDEDTSPEQWTVRVAAAIFANLQD